MTRKEKDNFYEKINHIITHEEVRRMQDFMQHGITDTYTHCLNVAFSCYKFVKKHNIKINEDELLKGALLHDFYLYDWHENKKEREGFHGFKHPNRALINAKKYFELTQKEENIISSHMWPLTLRNYPKSKEAVIVCIMDKWCAVAETKDKYLKKVKNLRKENLM